MLYKNIFIDDTNIIRPGIFFSSVNWIELGVSDESRDIAGAHRRIISPTYARVRTITLEGLIDRRVSDLEAVNHLQFLFRLQRHIERVDARKITIEDEYWRFWNISAKIKEPLEITDADSEWRGEYYRFRVVFESIGSPIWKSKDMIRSPSVWYGTEWLYWGVKFGTKLGKKWNASIASVSVTTLGTDVPIRLTLEATRSVNAPILVKNISTGSMFRINTDLALGDILVIDSENFRVFKNDRDITTLRLPGSPFPTAFGKTDFVVEDADGRVISNDIRIFAEYHNALL